MNGRESPYSAIINGDGQKVFLKIHVVVFQATIFQRWGSVLYVRRVDTTPYLNQLCSELEFEK